MTTETVVRHSCRCGLNVCAAGYGCCNAKTAVRHETFVLGESLLVRYCHQKALNNCVKEGQPEPRINQQSECVLRRAILNRQTD
ncbi:hypothetical protein E2C01_044930 [Portunus trituberculatus]|uniref:Uncharacterized protein n=1 Tax=Portunus trituberculatus TaxID=210409 RepID=A0A5B7FWW4_PORTR|nr:hypothetical protein [Portunus trituberculatus]